MHGLLLVVQLAQIGKPVVQRAQRLVVHTARGLLAVPGDERDGVALIDEGDGGRYARGIQVELGCKSACVVLHVNVSPVSFSFPQKR